MRKEAACRKRARGSAVREGIETVIRVCSAVLLVGVTTFGATACQARSGADTDKQIRKAYQDSVNMPMSDQARKAMSAYMNKYRNPRRPGAASASPSTAPQ